MIKQLHFWTSTTKEIVGRLCSKNECSSFNFSWCTNNLGKTEGHNWIRNLEGTSKVSWSDQNFLWSSLYYLVHVFCIFYQKISRVGSNIFLLVLMDWLSFWFNLIWSDQLGFSLGCKDPLFQSYIQLILVTPA